MDPKWYLVKTKPLNESRVFTRLTGAGYECLFPRIRKKARRTGRSDVRPLFPTYLFVRFALEQLRTIRYTHGVSKVVSFGPEPQEVEGGIVEAVRGRIGDDGLVTLIPKPADWKPGEKIRIGDGPFSGLEAVFVEELPDRERVVLLLEAVSSFKVVMSKESIER